MLNRLSILLFAPAAAVALASGLPAQVAPQTGPQNSAAVSAPGPNRDLSGVWNPHPTPAQRKFINFTFTQEPPEMTPWAAQKYLAAKPSNGPRSHPLTDTDDPILQRCVPPGTPRIYLQPAPLQIVHTPKEIIMIYEHDHVVRQIFMDGRTHPVDATPTYMGHSIGKWEDDTLFVDTVGFNEKTWLDRDGRTHSDRLHVTERFRRVDRDNLTIDITMEDPKALVKPWTVQLNFQLKPDWDIQEQDCADNESFKDFEK